MMMSACVSSPAAHSPCLLFQPFSHPAPFEKMHFQVSQKEKELPVPMSCDRRLFKSALSDLQGARTQPRLNLRPLSCRMSLSGTFVFMQVPGWSLNQISLTCSQDACRLRRDGSLFRARIDRLPAKRLCFGISWGRKCFLPFLFSGDIVVLQHSPPLS